MAYTIPRVTRVIPEADARDTTRAAYQDNLETCLDGRFPAFCDHGKLDTLDAARAREAEYQANLVTCIDPVWQGGLRREAQHPGALYEGQKPGRR